MVLYLVMPRYQAEYVLSAGRFLYLFMSRYQAEYVLSAGRFSYLFMSSERFCTSVFLLNIFVTRLVIHCFGGGEKYLRD